MVLRRVSLGAKVLGSQHVRRRGFGEDGIYLDAARNRYMGAISLGYVSCLIQSELGVVELSH